MRFLKAILTLTVSTACSYAATNSHHTDPFKAGVTIFINHTTQQPQQHALAQPEITQAMKTTAFSLAYLENVCEDLGKSGDVDRGDLCSKLDKALRFLNMINTTGSYDTKSIVEVSGRIKNDFYISEGEKSEWAENLRTVSRTLDDNLSIDLKSITTAIVGIEDIYKHLENSNKSVEREAWNSRLDNAVSLLKTLDDLDPSHIRTIEEVGGRIINDMYISTKERRDWAKELKTVAEQLQLTIGH